MFRLQRRYVNLVLKQISEGLSEYELQELEQIKKSI